MGVQVWRGKVNKSLKQLEAVSPVDKVGVGRGDVLGGLDALLFVLEVHGAITGVRTRIYCVALHRQFLAWSKHDFICFAHQYHCSIRDSIMLCSRQDSQENV